MTVVNPITGNQVTRYLYGTDRTSISPIIYRNDLLTAEIYPDSVENPADGIADRVEYQYNRLGERVWKRDQNGTVHQYGYDNLGRMIHDRVTDVGTGVDTAVRRISTVYNINGQVERLTSWDNPMVGTVSIVNEVRYEYNQYGLLGKEYSNPVGSADMSLFTEYFYDASKSGEYFTKKLRLTGYQTPSSYVQSYHFYNMENDYLNRPDHIGMDISYGYTGISTISKVTYHPVDAELDYTQPGTLDQFNRALRHTWKRSTGQVLVDIQHTYDRSGNRLARTDLLASSQGLSEEYSYDQMNQLAGLQRENNSFERFHYDAAGNHVQTTTDSAVETQTFNRANEIIAINNNSNVVSNDRNGNMTRIPGKDLTYDAWNRLVRVSNEIGTIAEYGYDALNRRVLKHTYDPTSSMPLIETREYYYNRNWQCLEELVYGNCAVRYLWGLRYIDDLVGFTSSYDFALTDANFNVVAVVNQTNVPERYTYSAFGSRAVRDEDFNIKSTTSYPALTRAFTGQVLDLDTGLMLYRNRYYSPSLGRFITRDPIGYKGDIVNLYRYANNQVVYENDPLGLFLEKFIPNGFSLGISRTCYGCIPLHRVIHLLPGVGTITSIASYALKLLLCIELQIRVDGNYCCDKNEGFVWRSKVEMCLYLTIKSAYSQESMGKLIRCTPKLGNPPKIHGRPPVIVGGPTRGMCPPKGVSGRICFGASVGYSSGSWGFRACYSPSYLNGDSNWFFEFGRGIFAVGTSVGGGGCMVIR